MVAMTIPTRRWAFVSPCGDKRRWKDGWKARMGCNILTFLKVLAMLGCIEHSHNNFSYDNQKTKRQPVLCMRRIFTIMRRSGNRFGVCFERYIRVRTFGSSTAKGTSLQDQLLKLESRYEQRVPSASTRIVVLCCSVFFCHQISVRVAGNILVALPQAQTLAGKPCMPPLHHPLILGNLHAPKHVLDCGRIKTTIKITVPFHVATCAVATPACKNCIVATAGTIVALWPQLLLPLQTTCDERIDGKHMIFCTHKLVLHTRGCGVLHYRPWCWAPFVVWNWGSRIGKSRGHHLDEMCYRVVFPQALVKRSRRTFGMSDND